MARSSIEIIGGANRLALLDAIAVSELGRALLDDPDTDDGYRVVVGSLASCPIIFTRYATHPLIGKTIDADGAGPVPASSAAGRYQLLSRYYEPYRKQLGLKDFGPVSQDLIALQQIRERRALDLIDGGNIVGAFAACKNIWASLPGAGYGQHENKLADLIEAYRRAGGKEA